MLDNSTTFKDPGSVLKYLDVFTGVWKTEGELIATDEKPAISIVTNVMYNRDNFYR